MSLAVRKTVKDTLRVSRSYNTKERENDVSEDSCGFHGARAKANDPKLSDRGGWQRMCRGGSAGAQPMTAGAVRCSAWDWRKA